MNERLNSFYRELKDKKVSFIGLGRSHRELLGMFAAKGAQVSLRDKRTREQIGEEADRLEAMGIRLLLGENYLEGLCSEDLLLRTPGMYYFHPALQQARQAGVAVTSEMELFFDLCPCKIYAVTGSGGQKTTTSVIAELLKKQGYRVFLGGNIGFPLLPRIEQIEPQDRAVVELSSFQLISMRRSPDVAVVTNVTPNHLDVHKDYQEYVDAKANIFTHQSPKDIAVFNADNADSVTQAAKAVGEVRWFSRRKRVDNGVFCENGVIYEAADGRVTPIMETKDILLPGVHNVENYMAAFAAVRGQVRYETMREIAKTFGGVEHRIELIRPRDGVRWYNDSIASSPSRTIAGLNSFPEKVILIAGGKDKGISYAPLGPVVNDRVKLLLLCGKTAGVIREAVEQAENYHGLEILDVADYHEAVAIADARSQPGDVVILSPASTSFDRFANFMERGQVFKAIVNELK